MMLMLSLRCLSTITAVKEGEAVCVCLQVLVTPLVDKGFLFLLSSVQMATPTGEYGVISHMCLSARVTGSHKESKLYCIII